MGASAATGHQAFSSASVPTGSTVLDRWALRRIHQTVASAPLRFKLWDGFELSPNGAPVATITFKNRRALFASAWDPDLNFGDAYMFGGVDIHGDLLRMLEAVYRALAGRARPFWLWQRSNDVGAARDNVHHHYDLGNDFYRLWLDREMVYTCAYFPTPDATLEDAQLAKMDRICRKLRLRAGERVVEAGCGWGSLALFMAERYGVSVTAFNLSSVQIAYARQRARQKGLDPRVTFVEDDYRHVQGAYDVFVSVGMLEHVGLRRFSVARRRHGSSAGRTRARSAAFHRPQRTGAVEPVDSPAHFSGGLPAHTSRGIRTRVRGTDVFSVGRGKSPPALCEDPRALARTVRGGVRTSPAHVRSGVRAGLAALSGWLARGVHDRHDAVVSGALRAWYEQRDAVDEGRGDDGNDGVRS